MLLLQIHKPTSWVRIPAYFVPCEIFSKSKVNL